MQVDYERLVLKLKAFVAAKPHHGTRDLLAEIARLEVENTVDGDPPPAPTEGAKAAAAASADGMPRQGSHRPSREGSRRRHHEHHPVG